MTNSSHPGTAAYYDSIVAEYASSGIDFLYLDGILGTCEGVLLLHLGPINTLCSLHSSLPRSSCVTRVMLLRLTHVVRPSRQPADVYQA